MSSDNKKMPKKNWLILVLILTNFIAIGYITTLHAKQYILSGLSQQNINPYPKVLQEAYKDALTPSWFDLMIEIRAIKFERQKLHDLMTAESIDQDAIFETQAKLRDAQMNLVKILHDAVPEALMNISAEERANLPNASLRSFSIEPMKQ